MWYKRAAEQNHARAQNKLGICYRDGLGVEIGYTQAVFWFKKAAEQNHIAAQLNLGGCYERGMGVEKDMNQALQYYEAAAASGDPSANERLTRLFTDGYFGSIGGLNIGHAAPSA
jgi:TPR repeat protein